MTMQIINRVKYDGNVAIALGNNRYSTDWRNLDAKWSVLVEKLSDSKDTGETMAQYLAMDDDKQASIKDIGGFVGGHFRGGRRLKDHVDCRQVVTLDLDDAPEDLWDQIMDDFVLDCAMVLYSTHKHRPGHPRYRIIIPLDRKVTAEEYEAIARKVADKIGIDYCDATSFRPTQLMYWPSHATDCAPAFEFYDAAWLSADEVLAEYGGHWDDISYWPRTCAEKAIVNKAGSGKQADPESKPGIVGAFCRTYDVPGAIDKYLSDVYVSAGDGRYTYTKGSTSGGLVIYDGGKFAYSNHSTDPASCQLCNAFDLVRLHLYGTMDAPGESGGKAESFRRMSELAAKDEAVKATLADDEKASSVLGYGTRDEGEPPEEEEGGEGAGGNNGNGSNSTAASGGMDWEKKLERGKDGKVKPSVTNAILILSCHPSLAGIEYNELTHAIEVRGKLPWPRPNKYWREMDESQLYAWVADNYKVQFPDNQFRRALQVAVDGRRFSPLRDRINALPAWDGVERVDAIFIDYLSAPDNPYVRAVTRASMIGAVKRAVDPGCKHDNVLVLNGAPGIGKSTLIAKLAGDFFSDSLKLTDMKDKSAAEKLQGVWIMEIGEMQGSRKADIECVKGFVSCQVDRYRPSYGKVVEQFPRSAVIWGTTNSTDGFLRDITGNRRFWPVQTPAKGPKSIWDDLTEDEVNQIWAEALAAYKAGESNYLSDDMEQEAAKAQQDAMVADDREGLVIDYLDTLIPDDFYSWTPYTRTDYYQQPKRYEKEHKAAKAPREYVSPVEIWVECFGKPLNQYDRKCAYEIASIMARIPGWVKNGDRRRIDGYGMQRVYSRA